MTDRNPSLKHKMHSSTRESEFPLDGYNSLKQKSEKNVKDAEKQPSTLLLVTVIFLFIFTSVILSGTFIYSNLNLIAKPEENKIAITVLTSPTCGCCHHYIAYLEENNFEVNQSTTNRTEILKDDYNVPKELRSCAHISFIENYVVEGHVPIEAIKKLIKETPDIDGIALPGMPSGSPGMSGTKDEPFEIIAFKDNEPIGIFMTI